MVPVLISRSREEKESVEVDSELDHRLSSYTQMSSVAEPSIGSLIGSLEAEGQLEGREEKEG